MERGKRRRDWSWRSHQIELVETVFRVSVPANDGGSIAEGNASGAKGRSEAMIAKLPNVDEGFVG